MKAIPNENPSPRHRHSGRRHRPGTDSRHPPRTAFFWKRPNPYHGRVAFEEQRVDALCLQLVRNPETHDVLLLPNLYPGFPGWHGATVDRVRNRIFLALWMKMIGQLKFSGYGDILSDLCAGLVGGLGLCPGANIGDDMIVFEPVHGSAPTFAGKHRLNPSALLLSAVMMLEYLGETQTAQRIEQALRTVLAEGKQVTFDLKSTPPTLPPSAPNKWPKPSST